MKKRPAIYLLSILAALFFTVPAMSQAEDAPPPLAEMWLATPKAGHASEFYKALAEHMQFRADNGDPRAWQAYRPLLGDELNRLGVRYCCFSWADHDAYRAWEEEAEEINAHFEENVAPHAESWAHYFEEMSWVNSHWSEAGGPYKLFAVTEFNLKPGHVGEFDAARDKMSQIALNQGWAKDHVWLWASTIGGQTQESIVIPHKDFASMARNEDSFLRFLSKHMGDDAAAELLKQFSNASWTTNFQIWEHVEELSMDDGN